MSAAHRWARTRLGKVGPQNIATAVLAVCLVVFAVKAVSSLRGESATWDETHYFGVGKRLLETGRWDFPGSILHPPLSYYLASLPLLSEPSDPDLWQPDPARAGESSYRGAADVARGQTLLSSPTNQGDRLLIRSRLMMVALGLLLGIFVFRWALELHGPWGGMLAIVLYAFCPNLLAHTRLITPDIALTTFAFLAMYFLWRTLDTGQRRQALLCGVTLGLALLSKYTALVFVPVGLLLALLARPWSKRLVGNLLLASCVGLAVLAAGYRFNLEPLWAGIAHQRTQADGTMNAFLAGEHSRTGWWYHQLVAFLLKTPIAMLILLGASLVLAMRNLRAPNRCADRMRDLFLLLPAVTVVVFFSINRSSIGLRYILPAYPFLFVWVARVVPALATSRIRIAVLALLVGWHVAASTFIHPHYLAYFNEIAGGPANGHRYLVDSNLDWGQDLKGLASFMHEAGIPRISLSYFGSDEPSRYGIQYAPLPSFVLQGSPPEEWPLRLGRYVAISATNLEGVHFANKDLFAPLRQRKPMAKIGYSIFVYDLR